MFLYINYSSLKIHPQLFPSVPVLNLIRWYGLMYIVAFTVAYTVLKRVLKEGMLDTETQHATEEEVFSFISTGIIFLLIGARVFSSLVYDTASEYWRRPWLIFWPFNSAGQFTGLAGMSYHGGFIGGLIGIIVWCKCHKKPVLQWLDAMAVAIPAGYTFGRIGNFLNGGELFGRVTTMPWGVVFPDGEIIVDSMSKLHWVNIIAQRVGMNMTTIGSIINLPRHPSQLYEAVFEGMFVFLILWQLRNKRPFDGFLGGMYAICYGAIRFILEYFRQPDAHIGFRSTVQADADIALNTSLRNISTGQILCALMIVCGLLMLLYSYIQNRKHV